MWLDQFLQDVRYAWRGMRQSPTYVALTVLTLAVGLGLVTVAFTVFNAYVLRPFAVRDPASLYRLGWRTQDDGGPLFRWRDYEELRDRRDLFDGVIAESARFVSLNGRPLAAFLVSGTYFETLGVRFALGRPLASGDSAAAGNTVVISHQAWTRLFGRDPAVLGRELDLNGHAFVIVGVLAPEFAGLDDFPRDVWVSLTAYAALAAPELVVEPRRIEIRVRLRADVSPERAQAALMPFMARMPEKVNGARDVRADVQPNATPSPLSLELLAALSPVFAAFVLVLVVACANVSNVMLSRALERNCEIAVRLSLGASRGRVVRQLLTEGLLIAVLAGVAGLTLAAWALRAGVVLLFNTVPPTVSALIRVAPIELDHRVFVFTLVAAGIGTLMFALLPALQASRMTLTEALHGQMSGALRGARLRSALVVGQVAVSLVLVIAALTLARNGAAVGAIDLGFQTHGVMSINVRGEEHQLVSRLAAALASNPRVGEVAVTGGNPLFIRSRAVAAAPSGGAVAVPTRYTFVSPEYFSILRIPIVGGRGFRADEDGVASRVAIVSAATARAFWPGETPVGKIVRIERPEGRPVDELAGYSELTIVGVVKDVVSGFMLDGQDSSHIYLPIRPTDAKAIAVLVRARSEQDLTPEALQRIFKEVVPDPQTFEAIPLEEMRATQMYPLRAASWVGSFLAAVALGLSLSGLYGVLTYTLSQRTKEIGIRMALGATAGRVIRLVVQQSSRMAGLGAVIGGAVAFALMRTLGAIVRFPTVSLVDLVAFGAGFAAVMVATAIAAYQPARRATRVDPAQALRADG
jgi:predicted permease